MRDTPSLRLIHGTTPSRRRLVGPESGWESVCVAPYCSLCGGQKVVDVWDEKAGVRVCRTTIDTRGRPAAGSAGKRRTVLTEEFCCGHVEVLWGRVPPQALSLYRTLYTLGHRDWQLKQALQPWRPKIHRWQPTGKTPCGRDVTKVHVNGGRPGDNGVTCVACQCIEKRDTTWEVNPGEYGKPGLARDPLLCKGSP